MSSFNDFFLLIGNAVFHVFWFGWAIGIFAAAINLCARKSDARLRFACNFLLLMLLTASFPVFLLIERTNMAAPVHENATHAKLRSETAVASVPFEFDPGPVTATSFRTVQVPTDNLVSPADEPYESTEDAPVSLATYDLKPLTGIVYIMCAVLMVLRLVLSSRWSGGMRRRCSDAPNDLCIMLESVAVRTGLRSIPKLKYHAELRIPAVIGTIRPIIALPLSMATSLTSDQLEAILMHEICHLRRYDHITLLLQRCAEIVACFHPAAWYLSRRISIEREHCSDDMVVRMGADRESYVRALCHVASQAVATKSLLTPAADGRRPSALRFRIARILGENPPRDRTAIGLLIAAMLLCMITAVHAWPQPETVRHETVRAAGTQSPIESSPTTIPAQQQSLQAEPEAELSTIPSNAETTATSVIETTVRHDNGQNESIPKINAARVRGTVFDPAGEPVPNAQLFVTLQWAFEGLNTEFSRGVRKSQIQLRGTSDADGHFALPLPENKPGHQHLIWAYTKKHGLTVWPMDRIKKDGTRELLFSDESTPLSFSAANEQTFQLVERLFNDDFGPKQSLVGSKVRPLRLNLTPMIYTDRDAMIDRINRQLLEIGLPTKKKPADMTRQEMHDVVRGHHFLRRSAEPYEIAYVPDEIAKLVVETAGNDETVTFRIGALVTSTDTQTSDGIRQWGEASRQVRVHRRAKVTGRIQGYTQMPAGSLTMRVNYAVVPIKPDGSFEFVHARGGISPNFEIADGVPFYVRKDGLVLSRPHQRNHVEYQAVKAVTVKGTVVTPDGKPVANATVSVASSAPGSEKYVGKTQSLVTTGDDGRFTAMVHPGRLRMAGVRELPDGFEDFWPWNTQSNIEPYGQHPHVGPGTTYDCGELRLVPARTITGQVLDTNNQPVPNALVQSYRWRKMPHPETRSDADGRFALKVSDRWLRFERMDVPIGTSGSLKAELLISTDNGWAIPATIEKRDPWIARIPALPPFPEMSELEKNILTWGVSPRVLVNQPLSKVLSSLSSQVRIDDEAFEARGIDPKTMRVTWTVRGTTLRAALDELLPRYNLKWVTKEDRRPRGYYQDSSGRVVARRYLWIQPR